MQELMIVDVPTLFVLAMIVSIQVIGIIQWLKNFKHTWCKNNYAIMSLLVTGVCAFMNTHIVSPELTTIFNITFLSLAITQLAWDVLVNAIPKFVSGVVNSMVNKVS